VMRQRASLSRTLALSSALLIGSNDAAAESSPVKYPRVIATVPDAFRGSWDEQIGDRCEGREPRYMLFARQFWEFEVDSNIRRVRLLDPSTIEIVAVTDPDEAGSADRFTITFRLADRGRGLIHPGNPRMIFRRCPHGSRDARPG